MKRMRRLDKLVIDSERMRSFELINETKHTRVCCSVEVAASPWNRMKGLLGKSGLPQGHGLILSPCNSIHTFFMKFPIDVVFLDKDGTVLQIRSNVKPHRWASGGVWARMVLEMAAGEIEKTSTSIGDRLRMQSHKEGQAGNEA